MALGERILNKRATLLRCINLNEIMVARLRAEGVIDDVKESRLEAVKAPLDRVSLLIDWIMESTDEIYESFLRVMEKNEHQHVANFLRGKEEGMLFCSDITFSFRSPIVTWSVGLLSRYTGPRLLNHI